MKSYLSLTERTVSKFPAKRNDAKKFPVHSNWWHMQEGILFCCQPRDPETSISLQPTLIACWRCYSSRPLVEATPNILDLHG